MNKYAIAFFIATSLFFAIPGNSWAWTEYFEPTRFDGMFYNSPQWTNEVATATWTDDQYATVDVQFGNPAPQVHRHSFGFSFPQYVGNSVNKIEVDVRLRRRYNVSPGETIEAYIVDPDGDIITALNATQGEFAFGTGATGWHWETFKWEDQAAPFDRVSQYFPYIDDYNFTLVLGVSKNGTSGSTNFVDISQIKLRFETAETALSELLPVDISKIDLAVLNLQDTLNARAPFAYFNAITGLDFSDVNQTTPTFYFPVPYPSGTVNYAMEIPAGMDGILSTLRTLTGVGIIGALILYLMRLSDRTL